VNKDVYDIQDAVTPPVINHVISSLLQQLSPSEDNISHTLCPPSVGNDYNAFILQTLEIQCNVMICN